MIEDDPDPVSTGTVEGFVAAYESALATQTWAAVEPLIHREACVTFSSGKVHIGRSAVQRAYEANFERIEGELFRIMNVHWVSRGADVAVYLFDFAWRGRIDGRDAGGLGRGTTVLVRVGTQWQLLAEHLGSATPQPVGE